MLGANAIVGGGPPIAVGAAIACRNRGDGRVSVAFGGDGSSSYGPREQGRAIREFVTRTRTITVGAA